MIQLQADFAENAGRVKPMHGVNNGPVYKFTADQRITNLEAFREAGIPYARTHDASFFAAYGGEHTVDILAIFPDFNADVNDPASYDFDLTDEYLKVIDYAGVKTFYRLGSKIEHWPKKYGTVVPPDFQKWAEICEHIIRHYTEGWNNGFHYDITYWEIWNEPDIAADDSPVVNKKCWGGTRAQFFELYKTAATHLKKCFPHLKIGGPALTNCHSKWARYFVGFCRDNDVPLDFFSWHCYHLDPRTVAAEEDIARNLLDEFGFTECENILNEWNYVKGWLNEQWIYTLRTEKGLKGSSFVAGTICLSQYKPLDLLMYYDARPCAMNGMFNTDIVSDKLKGYYPFWMFNKLYKLGTACPAACEDESIMACAAANGEEAALMFTYYEDKDEAPEKEIAVTLKNAGSGKPMAATVYVLDGTHDGEPTRREIVTGTESTLFLKVPLFTTCLITLAPQAE